MNIETGERRDYCRQQLGGCTLIGGIVSAPLRFCSILRYGMWKENTEKLAVVSGPGCRSQAT